jgi:hypothetical protein
MPRAALRAPVALLAALAMGFAAAPVFADAGWFESGDTVLRNDLTLLNDAEVIRLPISQWPIPRAAVRYALENGKEHFATNAAVLAALARVHARLDAVAPSRNRGIAFESSLIGGDPGLLRDFDTVGRENGELSGRAAYSSGENVEISLNASIVANPDDGDEIRLDGSNATVQLGNWLLSANTLDRWWGPAHESSLILSNNARPMPTVLVDRAAAMPFKSRWLSWIGPWRFSFGLSQMENERLDVDAPLFMAMRLVVMPFKDIEIGFSRTAQFCGEGRPCDFKTWKDMLVGNDNPGFDTTLESEPGNQMGGFDLRWNSPIGNWPYAIYSQFIGEDESGYTPAKFLAQFGIEAWKPLASGGLVQGFVEYADTSCSAVSGKGPYYDCAYTQTLFDVEGYRYHGRVVGHTTDQDSRSGAIGATYTAVDGSLWTATLRAASLNHDGGPDPTDTLTPFPADYGALEFGWRGKWLGQHFDVDLGLESFEQEGASRDVSAFGFVRWNYSFAP